MTLRHRHVRKALQRSRADSNPIFLLEALEPRLCLATAAAPLPKVTVAGPGQQVDRGADATFVVRLSTAPGTGKTVGVHFTTVNGNARAGVQYAATSGDLVFTGQEVEKIITVPTIAASPNPTRKPDLFSLVLSRPNKVKIQSSTARAAIVPIRPGITVSDVAVNEGNAGTTDAVFEVRLSQPASKTVTVQYATANDAAIDNKDYLPTFGMLTFLPGQTSKTIAVPVLGNTLPEPDKTFLLNLSKPVNAPIVKGSATGFILNDDGDPGDQSLVNPATVLIGNPGNPADTTTKLGAVNYLYKIGKYEQTVGDYVKFLNAVATSDPHGLFDPSMAITRTGDSGAYVYAAKASPDLPIEGITWMNAARFANWMNNGQGSASTETGAYTLGHGHITSIAGQTAVTDGTPNLKPGDAVILVSKDNETSYHTVKTVSGNTFTADFTAGQSGLIGWDYTSVPATHDPNATVWLPTRDEWFKAAYYDATAAGLAGGYYYRYATRSDTAPKNLLDGDRNRANTGSGAAVVVGSYTGSGSYYGTFDQTGNAAELSETVAGAADADNRWFFAENYLQIHGSTPPLSGIKAEGYTENLNSTSVKYVWNAPSINSTAVTITAGFRLAYSPTSADTRPTVSVQGSAVTPGPSGTVPLEFLVTLSAASPKAVLVRYATADGTATTANNDYAGQSGYLIFSPGQTQKKVTVAVNGQPAITDAKAFNLVLTGPVNATLQAAIGTGTIQP